MTRNSKRLALLSSIALMFALSVAPAVSAVTYTGQIVCLTPASCASSQTIDLSGPGSSATATFELTTNAPDGTSVSYFVCPAGQSNCSSNTGTDNGWSWTFTPATGTTGTGCLAVSCEGNGFGSPSAMSLQVTAPSVVSSSNSQEVLTIYACSQAGSQTQCNSLLTNVASLTVASNVPQFGLGIGVAMAVGLLGLVLVKRSRSIALPTMPA